MSFSPAAPYLLNPGPVTLTPRVRAALAQPDLCHREPEYAALQRRVQSALLGVYPEAREGHQALLLAGSGTAAVEAMVGTLVPKGGHALVVANGVYGERMAAMLSAHGKAHTVVSAPWLEAFDLAAVEAALAANPAISHVLAVHHETTTGRLNPIAALGALCKRRGVKLLLDAVSSFGAEALCFEAWNLEACAATANKCLHGVPGTSFVIVAEAALTERESGATSLYLDLHRYRAGAVSGAPPFTPAIPSLYALEAALDEFFAAGGQPAREALYRARSERLAKGLAACGVRPLLAEGEPSASSLRSYRLPGGLSYGALHEHLRACGYVIYAGQGAFDGQMFRLATMGDLPDEALDRLVSEVTALTAAAGSLA